MLGLKFQVVIWKIITDMETFILSSIFTGLAASIQENVVNDLNSLAWLILDWMNTSVSDLKRNLS